jgi:hypothetical protein
MGDNNDPTSAVAHSGKADQALLWLIGLIAVGAIVFAVAAIQPGREQFADCERSIKAGLKAPSTYKRISADGVTMDDTKPPEYWVRIEYDADNSFGVPLRDTEICKYSIVNGQIGTNQIVDDQSNDDPVAAASDAAAAAAAAASAAATVDQGE